MKINYLNNKDILKEIHKSKTTYCSYLQPSYSDYDLIVNHVNEIPKLFLETIETKEEVDENGVKSKVSVTVPPKALTARATRLTKLSQEAELAGGKKPKSELATVEWETIQPEDVIFRVMTWEHVPIDDSKKGKKVADYIDDSATEYEEDDEPIDPKFKKYTRCNFPPFKHYKLNAAGEMILAGISHWKGTVTAGQFSKDHGAMTKTLAHMFIKLCERYATRSNWRGYTYNDEMRAQALLQLSQIGLRFDEAKSDNPFAYYTAAITNSFTRVLNIEKRNQNIRDDILEINGLNPSYTRQGMSSGGGGDYDE